MISNSIKIIKPLFVNRRILFTLAIVIASIEVFGQWGCGTIGLTASPTVTSGCGQTITYTFSPPPGMVGSPTWQTSGSEQPSGSGSTVTVTWAGASGTRY